MLANLFDRPIPPCGGQQSSDVIVVEASTDNSGRVARHNLVRADILRHHTLRSDYCPIADRHARHDRGFAADPDVIADGGIAELFDSEEGIDEIGSATWR